MSKKKSNKIEVFLDDSTLERLEKEAERQGLSRSALARSYIIRALISPPGSGMDGLVKDVTGEEPR